MAVITRPIDEKKEEELQLLDEEFQDIKSRMSELRKLGKDTTIAELLALDFIPKFRMAKATYEKEDINKIKRLLDDINNELKEAEEGSEFSHVLELVKEAHEFIRQGKAHDALGVYSAIVAKYKKLPADMKRAVYTAALGIPKKIEKLKASP